MRVRVRGGFFVPDLRLPREVHLELTNECNLSCSFCYRRSWYPETGFMSPDLFGTLLMELKGEVRSIWLDGFGEPTLHPEFEGLVKLASRDFDLNLVTNGTLLRDRVLPLADAFSNIFVSVESAIPERYRGIRGSEVISVEEGIRAIAGRTRVWLSSVLMRSTYRDLPSLVRWASELGVRGLLLSNVIPTSEEVDGERLYGAFEVDHVSEVLREAWLIATGSNMKLVVPSFRYKTERWCPFVERESLAISYDGKVSPCLFTLHGYVAWLDGKRVEVMQVSFGDLRKKPLMDIWFSEEYVTFRSLVRLSQYPSCNDCPAWDGCQISESNQYDCWGNSPSCSFCPYYRGIVQCPNDSTVRGLFQ
ncbi:MAG: SPASM domain-containing protein [Candidatus Korarchaeum sp.]